MNTNLKGRLRNTRLPIGNALFPLFEAVVNSIHSIDDRVQPKVPGQIAVEIVRAQQASFQYEDGRGKPGPAPLENITGFRVQDNGVGFNDQNFESFQTLDSSYKAARGCRGVGRLLWLKAFDRVEVESTFCDHASKRIQRKFQFNTAVGVTDPEDVELQNSEEQNSTVVQLLGFIEDYRAKSPKTAAVIANALLEHCLWYFVRDGGAPDIRILDQGEALDLDDVYESYMYAFSEVQHLNIQGEAVHLTHLRLTSSSGKENAIGWCAAGRLVEEENLSGKIPGLYGKLRGENGDFIYQCYVSSAFLDDIVRTERFGFDKHDTSAPLFSQRDLSLDELRRQVIGAASSYLLDYLTEKRNAGLERLQHFTSHTAPRYRPVLSQLVDSEVNVDPAISDKDLELFLHKRLAELEGQLMTEGQQVMSMAVGESPEEYRERLAQYLQKADDLKKSDLVNYVFHRKVTLDILEKALKVGADGKYSKEELLHSIIMPLQTTSGEVSSNGCNLWLIDERLTFHDFLASDKPLSTYPITTSSENKEPDICALNVFDEPLLVSEGKQLPKASIVVIELKRPMRNDAKAGVDKDPIEQALSYLKKIRDGNATTATGRPIPHSQVIPGWCYAVCDLTSSIRERCMILGLRETHDHLGFFGFNANYNSYIEVISYDKLLVAAKERNRAFFDRLGLPAS